LTCTSLKDPSKRKDELHTMEAFCFVGPEPFDRWKGSDQESRPAAYTAFKERLTDMMFETLEEVVPGLRAHAVFHTLGTPLTNHFYVNSTEGNLYGTEKSLWQSGPFAWKTRTPIKGLHMVGASTTGHGVAGATMSGLFAAKDILGCKLDDLLDARGPALQTYPCDHPETWPENLQPIRGDQPVTA
jgi:phytoene dehydrogenase-like protein